MKKVLEPMKPFHGMKDMFGINGPYVDCVCMTDLSTLNYFGLSNLEILFNFYYTYKFIENERLAFGINNFSFVKRENVLKGLGIDINEKQPKMELLVDTIRESITNNRPIFLFVDLFYQEGRYFYYNNQHGAHACLVYGFDDENQEVYTIDNYDGYKTYIVSYETIVQYCKGIFEYCNFRKDSLYFREYCFSGTNFKFDEEYTTKVLMKFSINLLDKLEERNKSLSTIKTLSERLNELMVLPSFEENLLSVFDKRSSEWFMIKSLYPYNVFDKDNQILIDSIQKNIIDNWSLIRSITIHYNKSKRNLEERCKNIRKILDSLINDEIVYSDLLYNQLRRYIY